MMNNIVPFGGIDCPKHGYQTLTWAQYDEQMNQPNNFWYCPICSKVSEWIDQDDVEYDNDDAPF